MHIRTAQIRQNNLAFNIFVPNPVQEMVYLKAVQKNYPNGRFCVGNHRSKTVS